MSGEPGNSKGNKGSQSQGEFCKKKKKNVRLTAQCEVLLVWLLCKVAAPSSHAADQTLSESHICCSSVDIFSKKDSNKKDVDCNQGRLS